jgi:hypothetical protein
MKLFLSNDITDNRANEEFGGNEFIIETVSSESTENLMKASEKADGIILKAGLPRWLTAIEWLAFVVGISLVGGLLDALSGEEAVTLAHAYNKAPILFWIAAACLAAWLAIFIYGYKKKAEVMKSDEIKSAEQDVGTVLDIIKEELDVPENAVKVDILSCSYRVKNGDIKIKDDLFINFEFSLYIEEGRLILADTESKYAIELDKFTTVTPVDKTVYLASWNKEETIKSEKYREYKLREDAVGLVIAKRYYIVEFTSDDELYGICIPNYELPVIESLIGLRA